MEKPLYSPAAHLLAEDSMYESGDYDRPSDMLQRFKQWGRGESRASNEHAYPEFTGYYDTYLMQMWRDTSRRNAHYVARGNLATGLVDGGTLEDVSEMSWHQDLSELSRDRQSELRQHPDMQVLRDFPDCRGIVKLGGRACELYASADRITLTEDTCELKQVSDILKLESHIYRLRQELGRAALTLPKAA